MKKFGLIGKKIGYSRSKEIHESLYDYSYDIIELTEDEFEPYINDNDYAGFNITIPYKKKIAAMCTTLSPAAERTGSVNTVIYGENGELYGFNTDYFGFKYMCTFSGVDLAGKKVLILGSGGTSATLKIAAHEMNAGSVTIISRSGSNTYSDLDKFADAKVIINATPVGTYPDNYSKIVDIKDFPDLEAVLDVVYNPMRTLLLEDAIANGLKYSNGLPMLIAQAKFAGQIFLREEAALNERFAMGTRDAEIDKVFKELSKSLANIVLIGMPGSGKTVIGKTIAKLSGRKLVDIDSEIEVSEGMTIPKIFKERGEAYFRNVESRIIAEKCKGSGLVITPGGGSVLNPANIRAMKQNGIIIWIERNIEDLATGGRPLSKDMAAVKQIYSERKEIYNESCDFSITNNGRINDVSRDLTERLNAYIDKNGGFR